MNHITKIIEVKQVSDGAVAVLCRCCDDPATDSYHTMYLDRLNDINVVAEAEAHRARVEGRHDAMSKKFKILKDAFAQDLKI